MFFLSSSVLMGHNVFYKGRPNETPIWVAVGIHKLIDRWDACISVSGAYFEHY
jgi:hypothetical protein